MSLFIRRWSGPILIAATAAVMAAYTWGTWPDPIVDFGKEVYLAWQLSLGARLYTDVAYHLGPLSPYLNAAVFRIFGPTLATLEWFNLFLVAVTTVLLYTLIRRFAGALAASASGFTFVTLFAFTHYTGIADYNYISPYDHAHTHGLLLGLFGLLLSARYKRSRQLWPLLAAGFVLGLTFLTRAELFLAAAAGMATLLLRHDPILPTPSPGTQREGRGEGLPPLSLSVLSPQSSVLLLLSFLTPLLFAFLTLGLPGLLGSWPSVLAGSVVGNRFYRDSMGTLDLAASLWRLTRWSFCWAMIVLPASVAGSLLQKSRMGSPSSPSPCTQGEGWGGGAFFIVLSATFALWGGAIAFLSGYLQDPADAFAPLPLAVVVCLFLGRNPRRTKEKKNPHPHPNPPPEYRERGEEDKASVPGASSALSVLSPQSSVLPAFYAFAIYSLVLLGKIFLNARIYHYGFVLAMPATLLVIAVGIGWTRPPVRAAVFGALAITIIAHLYLANGLMNQQVYVVGSGPNQFRADERGRMVNDILQFLQQSAHPGQTLAVMPEGAMLNFLSGLPNSTPYWSFNPPYAFFAPGQGEAAGQARILASIKAHPPDWIILIAKDHSEFSDTGGHYYFGRDFGRDIDAFVDKNYAPVAVMGQPRFTPNGFGMILLRRVGS